MPWIRTISAHDATGELLDVYRTMAQRPIPPAYKTPHGGAPAIILVHSLNPALMATVFETSGTHHNAGGLDWPERELVAATVSRKNQCVY